MIINKLYLLKEEKSINKDVEKLADKITINISNDIKYRDNVRLSKVTHKYYYENTLFIHTDGLIKGLEKVKVIYVIYVLDSKDEYYELIRMPNATESIDSYSDYTKGEMRIVSAIIGTQMAKDFTSTIYHETLHLYQYGEGLQKRETLYDKVINKCHNGNGLEKTIALCLYFSFKHEQDAMAHEFYAKLNDVSFKGNFNTSLKYSQYYYFRDLSKELDEFKHKDIRKICAEFGYTYPNLAKRFFFSLSRFKRKLHNAYTMYMSTLNQGVNEEIVRHNQIACEIEMNKPIEIGIENIFIDF